MSSLQLIREKESEIFNLERMIYESQNKIRQLEKEKQELIKEMRNNTLPICNEIALPEIGTCVLEKLVF